MRHHIFRIISALALVAMVAGCSLSRRTSVADLKYNPGRYQDRTVSVEGVVTTSWSVPLVPYRFYKVDDGTGEVTVISQRGAAPSRRVRMCASAARWVTSRTSAGSRSVCTWRSGT